MSNSIQHSTHRKITISKTSISRRKITNYVMLGLCGVCVLLALIPLGAIMFYTIREGLSAINWNFFTELPKPVGELGGGMKNALIGTCALVGMSSLIGVPFGVLAGVYLAEYGSNRIANIIRFLTEVMSGLPSIIVGIFAYTVVVKPAGHFSAYAGAIALAILMIPVITKTTEELLKLVPVTYREAGLALGAPKWVVILRVVLSTAGKGIVTGVMLSIARAAGETAPLIFTAFGNQFMHKGFNEPIAALPLQIYTYAKAPYDDWHAQAWAGAAVLIVLVFILSVVVRAVTGGGKFNIQH
ncbi:MAG: phosphate ABC transporter permease PstA [Candidatus Kapabacteria bacterium]|nr:phosphate ABC transporter permease PstA [Candidatus Kapabacteria bacterium]MBX7153982.1 phosphate ABC transporter permease PstA [Bacteroidota bacterium]